MLNRLWEICILCWFILYFKAIKGQGWGIWLSVCSLSMETLAKSLILPLKSWIGHIHFHFEIPSRRGCRVGTGDSWRLLASVSSQLLWSCSVSLIERDTQLSFQVFTSVHTHTLTMHITSYAWIVKDLLFKHKVAKSVNAEERVTTVSIIYGSEGNLNPVYGEAAQRTFVLTPSPRGLYRRDPWSWT